MKGNNAYRNCHDYTSEYIVEFAVDGPLKDAARNYRNSDRQPQNYWGALSELKGSGEMRLFQQADCVKLPVPSLILFCTLSDSLQHSMIIYDVDAWVGANNGGSLGAPDDYVHKYLNLSTRMYQYTQQGGWRNQDYYNIYGDIYKMYFIPFKVNNAGVDYNNRMISGDADAGCGCLVM